MSKDKQGLLDYSGLLFDCPLKEQLSGCPFSDLRKHELKERLDVWKNLSEEERNRLVNSHHICIYEREQPNCIFRKNKTEI